MAALTAPGVLPPRYCHAFLGNAIDAVLIGYTGSMVPDRINGLDRCCWYKADRYYPPDVSVSTVTFPWGAGQITTFLHAAYPLLVERYEFTGRARLRLFCAPGPWLHEPDNLPPFSRLDLRHGPVPAGHLSIGSNRVAMTMLIEPEPAQWGIGDGALWVEAHGSVVTRYLALVDEREERLPAGDVRGLLDRLLARVREEGFARLRDGHVATWQAHHAGGGTLDVADETIARVYALTRYQLKATQHPVSGAIPVNNLRATWSSHVFWDAGFMHLLMLQLGDRKDAELACGFLERLRPRAAEHARAYGARGLKYEWETTHDGTAAYGVHRHLVHQVHNNAICQHRWRWTPPRPRRASVRCGSPRQRPGPWGGTGRSPLGARRRRTDCTASAAA